MLYEKLNPEMQGTVDAYVERIGSLGWRRRGELLAEAAATFGEDLAPDKAGLAARGFVTAVIERLGAPEVEDPFQAHLYLASLDATHRTLGESFLAENPQYRDAADGKPPGES